jgi:hypothetical protein
MPSFVLQFAKKFCTALASEYSMGELVPAIGEHCKAHVDIDVAPPNRKFAECHWDVLSEIDDGASLVNEFLLPSKNVQTPAFRVVLGTDLPSCFHKTAWRQAAKQVKVVNQAGVKRSNVIDSVLRLNNLLEEYSDLSLQVFLIHRKISFC